VGVVVGKGSAHSRAVTDLGYVLSCQHMSMNEYQERMLSYAERAEKNERNKKRIAGFIALFFFSPIIIFVLGILLTS
jgi:hypothetical protein